MKRKQIKWIINREIKEIFFLFWRQPVRNWFLKKQLSPVFCAKAACFDVITTFKYLSWHLPWGTRQMGHTEIYCCIANSAVSALPASDWSVHVNASLWFDDGDLTVSVLHTWCQTQGGQLCLITTDTLVPLNFKIHNWHKNRLDNACLVTFTQWNFKTSRYIYYICKWYCWECRLSDESVDLSSKDDQDGRYLNWALFFQSSLKSSKLGTKNFDSSCPL